MQRLPQIGIDRGSMGSRLGVASCSSRIFGLGRSGSRGGRLQRPSSCTNRRGAFEGMPSGDTGPCDARLGLQDTSLSRLLSRSRIETAESLGLVERVGSVASTASLDSPLPLHPPLPSAPADQLTSLRLSAALLTPLPIGERLMAAPTMSFRKFWPVPVGDRWPLRSLRLPLRSLEEPRSREALLLLPLVGLDGPMSALNCHDERRFAPAAGLSAADDDDDGREPDGREQRHGRCSPAWLAFSARSRAANPARGEGSSLLRTGCTRCARARAASRSCPRSPPGPPPRSSACAPC